MVDLIFTKYLKADISYQGVTRVETYPFPKEAIREAVFNAIAHNSIITSNALTESFLSAILQKNEQTS